MNLYVWAVCSCTENHLSFCSNTSKFTQGKSYSMWSIYIFMFFEGIWETLSLWRFFSLINCNMYMFWCHVALVLASLSAHACYIETDRSLLTGHCAPLLGQIAWVFYMHHHIHMITHGTAFDELFFEEASFWTLICWHASITMLSIGYGFPIKLYSWAIIF